MKGDGAKLLRQWERLAEGKGWRVMKPKGGHWKWYAPDGVTIVTTPSTPGKGRSVDNMRLQFRRAGLVVS